MTDPFAPQTAVTDDPFAAPTDMSDPFAGDPFAGPAPRSARPRGADLFPRSDGAQRTNPYAGRLLLISPFKIEAVPSMDKDGTMVDRMTADIVVLDGGDLHWGGKPEARPSIPHTQITPVPMLIERLFLSWVGVVNQCREAARRRAVGDRTGTMVLGRLMVSDKSKPGQSAAYYLADPTDADKALARSYLATQNPFA